MIVAVRFLRLIACLALALVLGGASAFVAAPQAAAQSLDEEALTAKRLKWQKRYRRLLQDRQFYTDEIARSKKNYAQAQRRNYPRGGARQQFLLDAKKAEDSLASTEQAIEELFVEARQNDVPPVWLYNVEETISDEQPASPGSSDEEEADRAGRNPLYLDDD